MSRVLITGANGFIGSNLCRHFLAKGWEVDALVRETSDLHFLDGLDVRLVKGDLERPEGIAIPSATENVVHAAALVSDMAPEEDCVRGIYETTRGLVRRLGALGRPLRRFVYISTALVLGFDGRDISEENPGRPADFMPYVRQKVRTEAFLLDEHRRRGFPVVILRPADVFGPYDRVACANILKGCEQGFPLIVGRGRKRFGYCYVGNLCQAVELALLKDSVEGRAYTVTNGVLPTWRDFFKALQRGLGRKQRVYVPVWFAYAVAAGWGLLSRLVPRVERRLNYYRIKRVTSETTYDISRTIAELGYRPDDDWERQFREIVDWYLKERRDGYLA